MQHLNKQLVYIQEPILATLPTYRKSCGNAKVRVVTVPLGDDDASIHAAEDTLSHKRDKPKPLRGKFGYQQSLVDNHGG
jgi:hypothetical protein